MISDLVALFSTIGTFATIGAIFDQFAPERFRKKVGRYIFGDNEETFADFEINLIELLMSPFVLDNRLRPLPIFFFTTGLVFIFNLATALSLPFSEVLGVYEGMGIEMTKPALYLSFFLAPMIIAPMALGFELFSFWVTKLLFLDYRIKAPISFFFIIFDFIISILPFLFMAAIFAILMNVRTTTPEQMPPLYIWLSSVLSQSMLSVVVVTIAQFFALILGTILRALARISHVNQRLSEYSEIRKYPMSYIGCLAGIIMAVLEFFSYTPSQ